MKPPCFHPVNALEEFSDGGFEAQVDFFEANLGALPPGLRQNLDKVAFLLLFLPVAKRIADCRGQTCGF